MSLTCKDIAVHSLDYDSREERTKIDTDLYVCVLCDQELKYYCQRYSNNSNPAFTGQEIMTICLFHSVSLHDIRASGSVSSVIPKTALNVFD